MSNSISIAQEATPAPQDEGEVARHDRAVRRYREEREASADVAEAPWWIDVGGEGEPC